MNNSTVVKMQHKYWVVKQQVSKTMGKPDDEFVVASDADLDAKLQWFKTIRSSCRALQKIVSKYDLTLFCVAYEENKMGTFLKISGKRDKTKAGEMMKILGNCLTLSGHQRIELCKPLDRIYQDMNTFCSMAVEDMRSDVKRMENARIDYRAALNWMKDVSKELDPDTYFQLDKFKIVQNKVKKTKQRFDHQKLVCLQKLEMLGAARCNMFSHVLIFYQQKLQKFAENVKLSFESATKDFIKYQQYDFKTIKVLQKPPVKSILQIIDDSSLKSTVEKNLDQNKNKNEFDLLSLLDTRSYTSHCFQESNSVEKDSEIQQYEIEDEFLPPQLLSNLLYESISPSTKKSTVSSNWTNILADFDPFHDPELALRKELGVL